MSVEVKVPTLGGAPVTLRLPPGTPNGRVFRVRGRGVTGKDGTRGDLLVDAGGGGASLARRARERPTGHLPG